MAGNPLSMLAGMTCLDQLRKPGLYERLEKHAQTLAAAARSASETHGVPVHIGQFKGSLSIQFTDERVIDFDGCNRSSSKLFARFFQLMLEQGILIPPSKYEALFISAAHSETDIAYTAECFERAFAKMA